MRVSLEWLKRYVEVDISPQELAEKLTMSGLSVEGVEYLGEDIRQVIVGVITELAPHPDAEKLNVAKVDVGEGAELVMVSGAGNLFSGAKVPVALAGATLPGGVQIEDADFRGVSSQGMLCSEEELGLAAHSDGIMILGDDAPVGGDIVEYLGLKDVVLDIELTANRPDCYSIIGVAREVSAVLGRPISYPHIEFSEAGQSTQDLLTVKVEAADLCPRYMAKVVTGVKVGPSPLWLKKYLASAGMRSINNVVDITNYVLLEQNQPLHAFDFDKLQGHQLVIRRGGQDERLVTLDEADRALSNETLVIADHNRPVCIAGVMGGANSEVDEATTTVVLESAWFDQVSIRRTGRTLGLRSEASARFERGVNPEGLPTALRRAAQLMVELCDGQALQGEIDVYPNPIAPTVVMLREEKVNGLLGTDFSSDRIEETLARLPEFIVDRTGPGKWRVGVPFYRRDISLEADLIEEIARLVGYERIPATLPVAPEVVGLLSPEQERIEAIRNGLVGGGLSEVITYSLTNETAYKRLGLEELLTKRVDLSVPLSEDYKFMRLSMLPSMVEVLSFNYNRGHRDLGIFEVGRTYLAQPGELPLQDQVLGLALMGNATEPAWYAKARPYDVYDLKGYFELVCEILHLTEASFEPLGDVAPYHPGRSGALKWKDQIVGTFGQLHPSIAQEIGFVSPVVLGEINLTSVIDKDEPVLKFKALPKFPGSRKDIAIVLADEISAERVSGAVRALAGEYLEEMRLFDLYTGSQIGSGKKSLAFSLLLRHPERTLTDKEIGQILSDIASGLKEQLGAELRS